MDVKQAVRTAKAYVADLFAEEGLANLGLEEVERDADDHAWRITVGFARRWNTDSMPAFITPARRSYKVVLISDDGEVLSVRQREGLD